MSAKHTPGPWIVCEQYTDRNVFPIGRAVVSGDGTDYFAIFGEAIGTGGTDDENIANARLFAAAPDLLQALQELVDEFDRYDKAMAARFGAGHEDYGMQRAIARAAIARATGAK